jgi:hypothetical protein
LILDKGQIIQLLKSQGKDERASQAGSELPDLVDTQDPEHAVLLSKYGIDLGGMPSASGNAF